jgi:peptidoglycan/LPS O-acetylase OafA/YrhL
MSSPHRIEYLDGIRGLAILLVLLYHAYARWPHIVPFGDAYASVPLFAWGWLGVQLFFLVSGFVILMTLESCHGLKDFLYRRWIRLFPAMLLASLLLFLSAPLFPERPAGQPTLASLLPGLTFIDIKWFQFVLGWPQQPLEGAFWSLYVEFKFYVFAGLVYFWRGRNALLLALLAAHALSAASIAAAEFFPGRYTLAAAKACSALGFTHFGWFAAGALFWLYHKHRDARWFAAAVLMAALSAPFVRKLDLAPLLPALLVTAVFALALASAQMQALLRNRVLLFLGFVSYPLYLVHENLLVALTVKAGTLWPALPGLLLPLLPAGGVIFIAWLLARFGEPALKAFIVRYLPRPARSLPAAQETRT